MSGALTEKQEKALLLTSRHGSIYPYRLTRSLECWLSTAQKIIQSLVERGLLEQVKIEPWRAGMKKRTYGLTIAGLSQALGLPDARAHLPEIVKASRDLLPLVLGKWDHFEREGVEDFALDQLEFAARYVCSVVESDRILRGKLKPITVDVELFTTAFYEPRYAHRRYRDLLRWFRVIGRDPEIRSFVEKLLDRDSKEYSKQLERNEEMKCMLKGELKKAPSRGRR